ncbi:MAG: thiol reductase thioredoxin [Burkholderiales bacterium]|nr:thiol reductase thioredoxin [Burkholderiales bacterium]
MHEPHAVDLTNVEIFTSLSTQPCLLEFWAPWCAPCLAMAPVMRELVHELQGVAKVGRVDVEATPDIARRFGVANAPTLVLFVDGQAVARVVGFQPSAPLKRWVRQILRATGPR